MALTWKFFLFFNISFPFLPVIRFHKNKYFYYFLILALIDPLYILAHYLFKVSCYHFMPFSLTISLLFIPSNDKKHIIVSIISIFLLLPFFRVINELPNLISTMAATCLIYFFIEELVNEYKTSSTLILFMPFMIFDILIDNFQIHLYFFHNNILTQYFTWFLAVGAFVPLIIAYLGPNKNFKISLNKNEITVHSENEPDPPNLHIIQLPRLNPINDLSYAEIRVFTLLAEGNNCKEISEKLFVCQRTVYFHIKNLKDKLNISSTSRLSSFAFANRENLPKFNKTSYFDSVKK